MVPVTNQAEFGSDDTQIQDDASLDRSRELSHLPRQPPLSLPAYTFERCLGEGAFGSVWLAREMNTGRQVAIKIYSHQRRLDWSLLSREVEKLAALDSSRHIVGLLGVGWDSDPPYYVMEYLEHGSLARYLADGPLSVSDAVRIAHGVLQGLVHAHGRGILHCDLKPGNVLLDDDFEPRLCDFGQSRLSHEQDPALGTLYYMAPEQADLEAVPDARWDVYALGALLYHLLSGAPPYSASDAQSRLDTSGTLTERLTRYRELVTTSPRPSLHRRRRGVDKRLAEIVDRCLRPTPERRYPNAQVVLAALQARERQRARRPLIALGGIAPLLLLAGMFLFGLQAMGNAVDSASQNLTNRALKSDQLSARFLARGVERELVQWQRELLDVAIDPQVRRLAGSASRTGWKDRTDLTTALQVHREKANLARKAQHRFPDISWFIVDHAGYQRWRDPSSPETLDQLWSHRDYYHGDGVEHSPDALPEPLTPIEAPHVSLAFRSRVTGKYMVALSVPIRDDSGVIVAILAGTRHLGQVLSSPYELYKNPISGQAERTIAVADSRDGRLLDHPWLALPQMQTNQQSLLSLDREVLRHLNVPAVNEIDSVPFGRFPDYHDPAASYDEEYQGQWLAAFSRVGNYGWFAIVQEKRQRALQPVDDMQSNLVRTWLWALLSSAVVITVMWLLVLRAVGGTTAHPRLAEPAHAGTPLSTITPASGRERTGD